MARYEKTESWQQLAARVREHRDDTLSKDLTSSAIRPGQPFSQRDQRSRMELLSKEVIEITETPSLRSREVSGFRIPGFC